MFIHLFIHSTNIIHSVPGHLEETFFSFPISCLPGRSVNWAISEADVEVEVEFSTQKFHVGSLSWDRFFSHESSPFLSFFFP